MNSKITTLSLIIMAVAIAALSILFFAKSDKVAYIDTSKLMEGSNELQALKKSNEVESKNQKAIADTLIMEFQEELKRHEKELAKMSVKEKQLSSQLLETKRNQIMQYQQSMQQKVQQDEQQKTQGVLVNINKYISEYGKEHSYKIIFATTNGNIAYADKGLDITEEIIKGINK